MLVRGGSRSTKVSVSPQSCVSLLYSLLRLVDHPTQLTKKKDIAGYSLHRSETETREKAAKATPAPEFGKLDERFSNIFWHQMKVCGQGFRFPI